MPFDIPRYIRCYDNHGKSADRYTVVFTGRYKVSSDPHWRNRKYYLGMSEFPCSPQGVGMVGESDGPCDRPTHGRFARLGQRITFGNLPEQCKELVIRHYRDIWKIPAPVVNAPLPAREFSKALMDGDWYETHPSANERQLYIMPAYNVMEEPEGPPDEMMDRLLAFASVFERNPDNAEAGFLGLHPVAHGLHRHTPEDGYYHA